MTFVKKLFLVSFMCLVTSAFALPDGTLEIINQMNQAYKVTNAAECNAPHQDCAPPYPDRIIGEYGSTSYDTTSVPLCLEIVDLKNNIVIPYACYHYGKVFINHSNANK